MSYRVIIKAVLTLVCAAAVVLGQEAQAPQQKVPQPKSKGELEALQAMFGAQDADTRIKAAQDLLAKYADTDFKAIALQFIAASYQQKNDFENMVIYAERTLEVDPKNYMSMLMLAQSLAQRTREHDLDREEKLGRSEKYANQVLEILKTLPKPNPALTDEQWDGAKRDFGAQAHEALAMASMVRKKYDVAIAEYKVALETATVADPATMVRLGATYNMAGKYDDAVTVLDKVMAMTDAHPQVKQFAQAERARAIQAKSGGAKAAQPAGPPAPAQIEIKKP